MYQNKAYDNKKRIIFIWGLFSLWALLLHLILRIGGQTDDTYFYTVGTAADFTYIQWIKDMWFGWSSRLIINCLCVFFAVAPHIIWKLVNTVFITMVPLLLWKMSGATKDHLQETAVLSCALFMMMPYIITGEAGWIATSVNYTLPAACVLICIYMLWKITMNQRIAKWEWFAYFAAACIATDAEQGCMYIAAVFCAYFFWMLKNKRTHCRGIILAFTLFSLLRMAMVFICPGNLIRKGLVIKENYPEYGDFGLFDKFLAGIYSVSSDFFLVFISLTFVMLLFLCLLVWKKHRTWWKRIISAIPVLFTTMVPVIIGVLVYNDYAVNAKDGASLGLSIKNVMTSMGILGNYNLLWNRIPFLFYIGLVLLFLCTFSSIWWALDGRQKYITLFLLALGCCTKGAIGFTGSVWLSHSRTGCYLVLTEMFVIMQLYMAWRDIKEIYVQKWFLYLVSFLAVLNAFVSYGVAVLYVKL